MAATMTRSQLEQKLGDALDRALVQPVVITKHGSPKNVLLSYEEYERLRALDRRIVRPESWTDEEIAALEAAEMEPGSAHLDAELSKG